MDSVKSQQNKQNPIYRSVNYNLLSKSAKNSSSKSLFLNVSIMAIALSILFYLLFVLLGYISPEIDRKFGIIIDAGSTGTRIHVFEYRLEGGMPRFDFGPHGLASMRVKPGLSSYADEPRTAGDSLMDLLDFAKRRVPREFRRDTDIRLMATAGLRLLDVRLQQIILASCRRVLKSSGFKFRNDWASVITGSDEGLYAWVIANYALGSLGGHPRKTIGIIELGGASVQVTFASSKILPAEYARTLKYGNVTYNLYSQSLLQFGQNAAFNSVRELLVSHRKKSDDDEFVGLQAVKVGREKSIIDPCTPKGYNHGVHAWNFAPVPSRKHAYHFQAQGNFSDCKDAAMMLLQRRKEQCSSSLHCSVGSTFLPKLEGKFLATENLYYTTKFFGLSPKVHLSDLMEAGKKFCESEWSSMRKKHPSVHEDDLMRYCFSSAYIVALLHDHLGVGMGDQRIRYTNHVKKSPLDWALGAFILRTTANAKDNHPDWVVSFIGEDSPTRFLLIAATSILFFVAWSFSKWRKPYLKTIYDLEKGRYIVTRISR